MKVNIENNLTVFPMVTEAIKFLDKKLGYKNKNNIVADIHSGKWLNDTVRYGSSGSFLAVRKSDGDQIRWRKNIPCGDVEIPFTEEPLVQVLALTMDKIEQPLALMLFFDSSCDSVFPVLNPSEQKTTLYIYSNYWQRAKSPSMKPLNIDRADLDFYQDSCMYANKDIRLRYDKLPTNFRTLLTQFHKAVNPVVEGAYEPDMRSMRDLEYEKDRHKHYFVSAVEKEINKFNQVLEKLYSDHVYNGVKGVGLNKDKFMVRELFKSPEQLRSMFESHERQQGTNLLEEVTKMEEDAEAFSNMVSSIGVTHFQASDKVVVCSVGKGNEKFTRWYQNFTDFMESEDSLITNKIHILDAALDRDKGKSPYIMGVGFSIQESEDGQLFGNTFRRSYLLDSQFDE